MKQKDIAIIVVITIISVVFSLVLSILLISAPKNVHTSVEKFESDILNLIPQETAERFMAVPLGEMQRRLVVAMLDADTVQAADFLSNKIGRPLKIYAASEEGIRNILKQYGASIDTQTAGALGNIAEEQTEENALQLAGRSTDIETLVQDSPISKALTTIMEYAAKNRASDIHIE